MQKNPIVFWELASFDEEKSVNFFREVFEWDLKKDERLGFYVTDVEENTPPIDGGIFTLKKAKLPFLTLYIQVEDIEKMAEKVAAHGGFIDEGVQSLPSGTKICLFNEPSGVTFAMLEPKKTSAS
jgi:predicted enzyme related to lactoylglutathione lyase